MVGRGKGGGYFFDNNRSIISTFSKLKSCIPVQQQGILLCPNSTAAELKS
jgi:hypothetical protein